jgi:2-polyprenyl-6-methoxyphenol hydroxylase-like FAD-dependent oxidoreductase
VDVLIIGAGIGGLTLGLMLHRAGISCRVFEAAPELRAVGVGINLLPHATRELVELGLEGALAQVAVTTREFCFYNRFGQFIYREPAGRYAGYDVPQFSIHRGDLQMVLLEAFIVRRRRSVAPDGAARARIHTPGGAVRGFRERQTLARNARTWS